ncbi:MAG TPA: RodZ domain-containing protein [Nitrospiria bacterium]|nr:RodZ domain-containing protein [Nitrospiria bacterium]
MGEFGQFIRRLRESQGQSLESITQATRIPYRHLLALEAEQFQALPSDASARGFVRLLARHYRTDAQELLILYERAVAPHGGGAQPLPLAKTNATIFKVQSGRRHAGLGMGVALIVVILLIFGWMRNMQEQITPGPVVRSARAEKGTTAPTLRPTPPQPAVAQAKPVHPPEELKAVSSSVPPGPQAKSEPAVALTAPAQSDTTSKSIVVLTPPAPAGAAPKTVDAVPAPPPLRLEIEAHEPSWVQAALDGGEVKEALLQAGERITWTANDQMELTLGNAGGLALSFNGQSLAALGRPGQVVRLHLTKDGPDHVRRSLPPKSPLSPSPSPSPLSTPQPPAPSTFAF